jgi:hypothetical protein
MSSVRDEIHAASTQLSEAIAKALAQGDSASIEQEDIARAIGALANIFSLKVEREGVFPPVPPNTINATDAVVLITELLKAADLNVFDLAMWTRRAS